MSAIILVDAVPTIIPVQGGVRVFVESGDERVILQADKFIARATANAILHVLDGEIPKPSTVRSIRRKKRPPAHI